MIKNGVQECSCLFYLFFSGNTHITGFYIILSCAIFPLYPLNKVGLCVVMVAVATATCTDRLEVAFLGEFFKFQ